MQARDPAPHYQRKEVYNRYYEAFHIPGIEFQPELPGTKSNRWLTALRVYLAQTGVLSLEIIEKSGEDNVEARPVWKPMHLQPLFERVTYYLHED